ncbi:transglutaminase family protein [Zavarzinia compransoris]|uniref:Transglutaminase n=1 Tax=Zavarzinia compransoris TaxID=1264899 RepID=A0A317DW95_9PROT|nr:transglutaminase family protein [Zavarzinia compransoris]PWR18959.1 transglutaminase [Zavarzinia compransoris]TDP48959.1 transglutaminase-like putative cysteine protease [Zavarzinia compransoris]
MIRYQARHNTVYDYGEAVTLAHHLAHLKPRPVGRQEVLRHELRVVPEPTTWNERTDGFGNPIVQFAIEEPHQRLIVESLIEVEIRTETPPAPDSRPAWDVLRARLDEAGPETLGLHSFRENSILIELAAEFADFARPDFPAGRPIIEAVAAFNARIHRDFAFDPQATTVTTPPREVLRVKRGVCQDFAHLMIACLRSLGLPACYVSGYLRTTPPPGRPRLVGSDQSHAWVAVWIGGGDWLELDPTNDCIPSVDHITVAHGRDYDDVAPLRGIIVGGGPHRLQVGVDVVPLKDGAAPKNYADGKP